VRVKSAQDILASLDAQGCRDGVPFMDEMRKYCGGAYTVFRPVNRILVEGHGIRALDDVVMLADTRCDGQAHGGCQRFCHLFWKTAWLTALPAVSDAVPAEAPAHAGSAITASAVSICQGQAPVLLHASTRLPCWDVRQYLRDLRSGTFTAGETRHMLAVIIRNTGVWGLLKLKKMLTFRKRRPRPPAPLHLQAGEWVRIRHKPEILATLDQQGKTRGLLFGEVMWPCCGGRYRVLSRVERMIVEPSGKLQQLSDTVMLEGVACDGIAFRGCPRRCYWLWKEAWLQRMDEV
jgi:hypothetical protein